jgi:hypothetical protein
MKWVEVTVELQNYEKFNEALKIFVKPLVKKLYSFYKIESWNFFREPELRLRILARYPETDTIKFDVDKTLKYAEKVCSDIFKNHYFSCHGEKGKEYNGEQELYGEKAWELCYKRWEAGSNLALELCTTEPEKSLPFHYTRDIHLFENQLGFELSDAITIYLKWVRTLMNCDESYKQYNDKILELIKETSRESKVKGI